MCVFIFSRQTFFFSLFTLNLCPPDIKREISYKNPFYLRPLSHRLRTGSTLHTDLADTHTNTHVSMEHNKKRNIIDETNPIPATTSLPPPPTFLRTAAIEVESSCRPRFVPQLLMLLLNEIYQMLYLFIHFSASKPNPRNLQSGNEWLCACGPAPAPLQSRLHNARELFPGTETVNEPSNLKL